MTPCFNRLWRRLAKPSEAQARRLRTNLTELTSFLESLSDRDLQELLQNTEALAALQAQDPLSFFAPYPKQLDFFTMGETRRERLLQAGNQTGKSAAGAFEASCHATGNYPPWWTGRKFNRPTNGWTCGASGQSVRDIAQLKLIGARHDETSIGLIAPHLIVGKTVAHGTGDLYDIIRVRHASGGISTITAKTFDQDVNKWMGQTLDWVWVDEEAPLSHYAEALARLRGDGIIWITFTPLAGYTEVVSRFLRDDSEDALRDRGVVKMGLKDAQHFTEEEKRQRLASYPLHERAARENGDPTLGSGAIFTTPQTQISLDQHFEIPLHFAKLWGLDWGVTHPFAAVLIAWDRDSDVIYVVDCLRMENARPVEIATAIKRKAGSVRCAWPHDMNRRESDLDTLATTYKREGLLMLPTHANFPDGSISTEAGILEMQERMVDGRLRVKAHCADWFDEFRSYHRDQNGKIVKVRDDLMSATRIAIMARRHARPAPITDSTNYSRPQHMAQAKPQLARMDFDPFRF